MTHHPTCEALRDRECGPCSCGMTDDLQRECEELYCRVLLEHEWRPDVVFDRWEQVDIARIIEFAKRQRAAGLREAGDQACEQATRMNDRTLDCACHMDMAEVAAWCAKRAREVQDGKL